MTQPSRSRQQAQALPEPTAAAFGLDPQHMGIVDGIPFGYPLAPLPAAPRPLPPLGLTLAHTVTSGLPLQEAGAQTDSIDSSDAGAFRSAQFLGGAGPHAAHGSGLGSGNVTSRAALFNSQRGPSSRNIVLQIAHNNSTAGGLFRPGCMTSILILESLCSRLCAY